MRKLLAYQTRIGTFYIAENAGQYHPMFEGDSLGGYDNLHAAIWDLANGTTTWPAGVNPATLGIPEQPEEWTAISTA